MSDKVAATKNHFFYFYSCIVVLASIWQRNKSSETSTKWISLDYFRHVLISIGQMEWIECDWKLNGTKCTQCIQSENSFFFSVRHFWGDMHHHYVTALNRIVLGNLIFHVRCMFVSSICLLIKPENIEKRWSSILTFSPVSWPVNVFFFLDGFETV